ncbi:MAG: DUF4446 family protein [Patescibacteria group bacterium]
MFPIDTSVLASGLLVLTGAVIGWVIFTEIRLRRFLSGQNGKSMEGIIRDAVRTHGDVLKTQDASVARITNLELALQQVVRGIGVVRFNALTGDTSGNQSFSIALLSPQGNGVVISSIHARESGRIYAKVVNAFSSPHELTDEEKKAIVEAQKRCA